MKRLPVIPSLLACVSLFIFPLHGQEESTYEGLTAPLQALQQDEAAFTDTLRSLDRDLRARIRAFRQAPVDEAQAQRKETSEALAEEMRVIEKAYAAGLRLFPQSPRLHNYFGEVLYDWRGQVATAIKEWNLALLYKEGYGPAHNNLGLALAHQGNLKAGLRHLDRALETDKNHPDYLFNLAQIYLASTPQVATLRDWKEEKVYKEAMKLSKKARDEAEDDFELAQDYAVNFFAAERFGVSANWKKAAEAWEEARGLARNSTERFYTWLNEARVWIRADVKEKAAYCLGEARQLWPESPVVKTLQQELGKS